DRRDRGADAAGTHQCIPDARHLQARPPATRLHARAIRDHGCGHTLRPRRDQGGFPWIRGVAAQVTPRGGSAIMCMRSERGPEPRRALLLCVITAWPSSCSKGTRLMSEHVNQLGQPIGFPIAGWTARPRPPRTPMEGRFCRVEPIDVERHAADLHAANREDEDGRIWTYLAYGPFERLEDYRDWMRK